MLVRGATPSLPASARAKRRASTSIEVGDDSSPWSQVEVERASHGRPIQQPEEGEGSCPRFRPDQPELNEVRKLLSLGSRDIDGKPTRGQAVHMSQAPAAGSMTRRGTTRPRPCAQGRSAERGPSGQRTLPDPEQRHRCRSARHRTERATRRTRGGPLVRTPRGEHGRANRFHHPGEKAESRTVRVHARSLDPPES